MKSLLASLLILGSVAAHADTNPINKLVFCDDSKTATFTVKFTADNSSATMTTTKGTQSVKVTLQTDVNKNFEQGQLQPGEDLGNFSAFAGEPVTKVQLYGHDGQDAGMFAFMSNKTNYLLAYPNPMQVIGSTKNCAKK
jgi:hypothetical protein